MGVGVSVAALLLIGGLAFWINKTRQRKRSEQRNGDSLSPSGVADPMLNTADRKAPEMDAVQTERPYVAELEELRSPVELESHAK